MRPSKANGLIPQLCAHVERARRRRGVDPVADHTPTIGEIRIIQCVANHHPLGVELRYVMNSRLLMSRVFDSWERLTSQAQVWREGLQLRGWVEPAAYGRANRR